MIHSYVKLVDLMIDLILMLIVHFLFILSGMIHSYMKLVDLMIDLILMLIVHFLFI